MSLFDKINDDIKTAMKTKDKEKLEALRAIKSDLLLLRTSGKAEVSEEMEIQALQKMIKQRKESARIYAGENRKELAEKELKEAAFMEPYLPKQFSEEEIEEKVKQIIQRTGASGMQDMGKVMGEAVKQMKGKAEGSVIASKVKEFLA